MLNPYETILSAIDSHLAVASMPFYSPVTDDSNYWEFDEIEQLHTWKLFFEAEPSRLQVLSTCCRFATFHGLMHVEEIYLYAEIESAFGFSASEYFHNFCEADDYQRFYGCYCWMPVEGNERDFGRTKDFEAFFHSLQMEFCWRDYEQMANDENYLILCENYAMTDDMLAAGAAWQSEQQQA